VYETGRWRHVRKDGTEIVIENMLPLAGRWLSTERADEIRGYLAQLSSTRLRPRVFTFTGQPVLADGVPSRLRGRRTDDGRVLYYLRAPEVRRVDPRLRAAPLPPVPADDLAASIADGLAEATEALPPLLARDGEDDRARRLAELAGLRRRVARLTEGNRRRFAALDPASEHYEPCPVIRRELRLALDRDAAIIDDLEAQERRLDNQIAAADQHSATTGLPPESVLPFVLSLRDPAADAYRAVLRAALQDVTLHRIRRRDARGGVLTGAG
jgi:hypothetical protein